MLANEVWIASASSWRAVPGYPTYEVSGHGEVRRAGTHRPVFGSVEGRRVRVTMYGSGGRKRRAYTSRLTLELFVGPCPDGYAARHRNGDFVDDRLENLYWGTPPENQHSRKTHCKRGHELWGDNVAYRDSGRERACRECIRVVTDPVRKKENERAHYLRNREDMIKKARLVQLADPEYARSAGRKSYRKRKLEHCEEVNAAARTKNHRRRSRKANRFVADVSVDMLDARDGGRECHICLEVTGERRAIEHVVPIAKGGTHEPDNCAMAHMSCNARKSTKIISGDAVRLADALESRMRFMEASRA